MKFENLTMTPDNLITQDDTVITAELRERVKTGSIRIDMELHPFEMLKLVQLVGVTNIALTDIEEVDVNKLNEEVLDGRISELTDVSKVDYKPIGSTLYRCTALFTGTNIFVLTGLNPSDIFTKDGDNVVINGNHIVINQLMNSIYSDIYTMAIDETDKVRRNPLYKTRFQSSNGLPSLRYLSNSVITLDMDESDSKKLKSDMDTFKQINNGDSQYGVVFYTAVFICNVTLKSYIEMELTKPSCITITARDSIDIYSKYPVKQSEATQDMILTRLYMLPEDYKLDVAVKVNITRSTMAVLGVQGISKVYNDIYSQIDTLIEKAKLITL